jgi:DNA-binding response OmpR family regulator
MNQGSTILFVDDEPGIRATLPAILDRFGFVVTPAATVPEALHLVATQKFDVLIADLNIGQPGDGFTVVSAMRRTQPKAVTFILTGYPAFESALEAIRQQVDDYLIKPADVDGMVEKIKLKLAGPRTSHRQFELKRLTEILEQNKTEIFQRWLSAAKKDPQITSANLSDQELTDHLPSVIEAAIGAAHGDDLSDKGRNAASAHGRTRFRQGCTIASMMRECRLVHHVLTRFIQENLLVADISSLVGQVMQIGEIIHAYYEKAVKEYVNTRYATSELVQHKGKSLLLLSLDRELTLLREHALSRAGYSVTTAESRKEALQFLKQPFDVLVISHSMLNKNITEKTQLFREQNPNSPIITVTKGKWQEVKLDADHAVSGEEGPAAMLEAVEAALTKKQLRRIK